MGKIKALFNKRRWRCPKSISLYGEEYQIRFVKKISCIPNTLGYCDSGRKVITIQKGLTKAETIKTLVHEIFHVIEFEAEIKIPHKLIADLEDPLYSFFLENLF